MMARNDRRSMKWSLEIIILIIVTITSWATSAGMMWQHISDVDQRLSRVEQKLDKLTASEDLDHGKNR
jgi:hypothetical protein